MRLDVGQHMKMDQRMALAPRMIQSMEILQLPLLALQERIEQEMLSNPVLELEEPGVSDSSETSGSTESDSVNSDSADGEQSLLIKDDNSNTKDFERLDNIGNNEDYDDYWSRSSYQSVKRAAGEPDRKFEAMQNTAAPELSLNEFLHQQWSFIDCDPVIEKAGKVILDFIGDTGYLTASLESLAERFVGEITSEQMARALELVQTLEPSGVGCRNLAECLLIQLSADPNANVLEIELIENHLKDIEMNRYPAVVQKTKRPIAEIKQAIKNLSRLDPHPGLQYARRDSAYVVPDIIVEYDEVADVYTARLTDVGLPSLRINHGYATMAKKGKLNSDAKEFLQNSVRSARWLIESIEQRRTTLLRVVNKVILTQREFLDHGKQYLKPLPMVDLAEELGVHVGTISRAVSGKYVQTPSGIFPLRSFFSSGTANSDGESVSWDAVRAKLQEIVDGEDKANPYNDDQLVEQLAGCGLTLARRTVAKYRGLLNIPPARRRKEFD